MKPFATFVSFPAGLSHSSIDSSCNTVHHNSSVAPLVHSKLGNVMSRFLSTRWACLLMAAACFFATPVDSVRAQDDGRLSAIGGLSAAHMYTTYVAIGATADAFGNDVYDSQQVQDIMGSLVGMIDTLKNSCCSFRKTAKTRTTRNTSTKPSTSTPCSRKKPASFPTSPKAATSPITALTKKPALPSGLKLRNSLASTNNHNRQRRIRPQ